MPEESTTVTNSQDIKPADGNISDLSDIPDWLIEILDYAREQRGNEEAVGQMEYRRAPDGSDKSPYDWRGFVFPELKELKTPLGERLLGRFPVLKELGEITTELYDNLLVRGVVIVGALALIESKFHVMANLTHWSTLSIQDKGLIIFAAAIPVSLITAFVIGNIRVPEDQY